MMLSLGKKGLEKLNPPKIYNATYSSKCQILHWRYDSHRSIQPIAWICCCDDIHPQFENSCNRCWFVYLGTLFHAFQPQVHVFYSSVHEYAFETNLTVVSTCCIFGLYHSEVPEDKTWILFKWNLCSRSAPSTFRTLLVFHPQSQTRAILKQKPSKGICMQGCQVPDAVSIVTATSIDQC